MNTKKASDLILASVGVPFPWFRDTPPVGCLELDGSILSNIVYSRLWEAMGQYLPAIPATTVVPIMTSATAPSGQVWKSAEGGSPYEAWRAFDGVTTAGNYWSAPTAAWIAYQFAPLQRVAVTSIKIRVNTVGNGPIDFTFKGSDDTTTGSDGTWTTLLTKTGEATWGALEERTYTLTVSGSFRTYKLDVTTGEGGALTINELYMYSGLPYFALPDMRDNFLGGWDHVRAIGDHQYAQFQGHWHAIHLDSDPTGYFIHARGIPTTGGAMSAMIVNGGSDAESAKGIISDGVNGLPSIGAKTRPSNICAMWCVKY
jgi:hypothetical protein